MELGLFTEWEWFRCLFHVAELILVFTDAPIDGLKLMKVAEIIKNRGIPIVFFCEPDMPSLSELRFKCFTHLNLPHALPPSVNLDLLWHVGWFCTDRENPWLNWNGFMHEVTGSHDLTLSYPPLADIQILPIIHMKPNDTTCLYSTLLFVEKQARLRTDRGTRMCLWFSSQLVICWQGKQLPGQYEAT